MAKGFHEWINRASNYTTIAAYLGLPLTGAGLVGFWSYAVSHLGAAYAAQTFCIIFVSLLWSIIGLVWVLSRPDGKCDWGFSVAFAILNVTTQADMPIQLFLSITNDKPFPLKVKILSRECIINNLLPNCRMQQVVLTPVVGSGKPLGINFEGYTGGAIVLNDVIHGTCEIHLAYGRPGKPFTRKMSQWLDFTLQASASPRLTESGAIEVSFIGSHPVSLGLARDPIDSYYRE